MRLLVRFLIAAAVASMPLGLALLSCGTDAVGVDACRTIETARCNVAPECTPGFDVSRCQTFYRDECLNGIADTTPDADPSALAPACVQAIDTVAACVDSGAPGCLAGLIAPDASCNDLSSSLSLGCNLILNCPEALAACSFLAAPVTPDAGTADADADATEDADGAPDAGEDAGDAGDAATD